MRFHPRCAAVAALFLAGTSAFAQQPPPPPMAGPAGGPGVEAAGPAADAAAVPVLTGRIQRWLVDPKGDVDGMLLADGTQVAFPPHLSDAMTQTLKVGDSVRVAGWHAPGVPVVRATSLTSVTSGRSVADRPPAARAAPRPPREPGALTAMSGSGSVARLLYTDRGDTRGAILDDGTIVRFPPHVGASMAPPLQPGSMLHARGWGSRGVHGSAFEATAMGPTADGMRDVFAGPGREAGAPSAARGARGPRGPAGPAAPGGPDGPQRQPPVPTPPPSSPTPAS